MCKLKGQEKGLHHICLYNMESVFSTPATMLPSLSVRRTLKNGLSEEEKKHIAAYIKGY